MDLKDRWSALQAAPGGAPCVEVGLVQSAPIVRDEKDPVQRLEKLEFAGTLPLT
jgi:hypothetical protein